MVKFLFLLLAVFSSIYVVLLIRSFGYMSIAELRRRVKAKDTTAIKVYEARQHGLKLWFVLWCIYGFTLSVLILIIDSYLHRALALLVDIIVIVFMHVVLPWSRWPKPSLKPAARASRPIAWIIRSLKPVLHSMDTVLGPWVETEGTIRIHSKEELLEVLQKMPGDLDKVGRDELRIAMHALKFGELQIMAIMTPRSVVKTLKATEKITPVLLGELHDSGFSRFPVWDGSQDNFVGVLYLKDQTNIKQFGMVKEHMRPEVFYVNEATNLDQVLNAFLRTQHHLFIVVNEYEEIVGVISIEDVIEQIIGRSIIDEFDQYEDLREVAKQKADEILRKRSEGSQTRIT